MSAACFHCGAAISGGDSRCAECATLYRVVDAAAGSLFGARCRVAGVAQGLVERRRSGCDRKGLSAGLDLLGVAVDEFAACDAAERAAWAAYNARAPKKGGAS